MAATVTIDKSYFETLIRRAEPHASSEAFVTIPIEDHNELLRMAREYTSLRDALYRGGIAPETLEILINGSDGLDQAGHGGYGHTGETSNGQASAAFPFSSQLPLVPTLSKDKSTYGQEWQQDSGHPGKLRPPPYSRNCSYEHDDASFPSDEKEDMTYGFTPAPRTEKQYQSKEERRTLVFKGLLDRTTHKDIIDVLSGGALLDIFLRSRERMASVSFVEGAAAQDFLYYAKRNDIYIHGKRIEVAWNDRQFILPHHVAQKIRLGATRNITVHNVTPAVTADSLREDLDHIHNLVVVNTKFEHGNAYISLNSIHNSLFARTCMRSRLKFKGMLIDWYPDECARPLPRIAYVPKKENVQPVKKLNPMANRFQLLNMDGTEDGSEDEEEELTETSYTSVGLKNSWADRSIAV